MRLEHGSLEDLRRRLLGIIRSSPELQDARVFFFGSRVTGGGNERSDVDVGILAKGPIPARVWLALQEALEDLPTLYSVDLVDFHRVPAAFREIALRTAEEISHP
jgi:predicted nucleotidyltransferase